MVLYYFDNFRQEIITEKDLDKFAPPERYFEIYEGAIPDVIVDTYLIGGGPNVIDFAWTMKDVDNFYNKLYGHLEHFNVDKNNVRLIQRRYPKDHFCDLLKYYGIKYVKYESV